MKNPTFITKKLPFLGDFGIAKKLSNKDVQQALHSLGTEKYFSPEYTKEGFSV